MTSETIKFRFKAASVIRSGENGATSAMPELRRRQLQLPELPQLLLPRPDGDDENLQCNCIILKVVF